MRSTRPVSILAAAKWVVFLSFLAARGVIGLSLLFEEPTRAGRMARFAAAAAAADGSALRPAKEPGVSPELAYPPARRRFIASLALIHGTVASPHPSRALPFVGSDDTNRRQLELCLVNVLRVQLWAESIAAAVEDARSRGSTEGGMTDEMKGPYLEARLGAKALLTGRVGGGANGRVYSLSSVQIRGCLSDAIYSYGKRNAGMDKAERRRATSALEGDAEAIFESLSSVVEFDGLETTQDPSPRSSLMLRSYTEAKAVFVRRTLRERLVPACRDFVGRFGDGERRTAERYLVENYPSEMPGYVPPPPPPPPPVPASPAATPKAAPSKSGGAVGGKPEIRCDAFGVCIEEIQGPRGSGVYFD